GALHHHLGMLLEQIEEFLFARQKPVKPAHHLRLRPPASRTAIIGVVSHAAQRQAALRRFRSRRKRRQFARSDWSFTPMPSSSDARREPRGIARGRYPGATAVGKADGPQAFFAAAFGAAFFFP